MRISDSFSKHEVEAGEAIFATVLRGGDPSVMMASKQARSLLSKFTRMRQRADGVRPTKRRGEPLDRATIMTAAGLRDVLSWGELGALLGRDRQYVRRLVMRWQKAVGGGAAARQLSEQP